MKIFLDSSVLIAALLSSSGASAQILEMCEAGLLEGFISTELFEESLSVVRSKFPEKKEKFERTIRAAIHVKKIPPRSKLWKKAKSWISDPKDVMVLAGAKILEADFLITLDIRDFIKDTNVSKMSGLTIGTPGDFLDEYYRALSRS